MAVVGWEISTFSQESTGSCCKFTVHSQICPKLHKFGWSLGLNTLTMLYVLESAPNLTRLASTVKVSDSPLNRKLL